MIVASLMLVIAAAVTLLVGLLNRDQIEWVYASIGCCLLAGLLLTIGVLRSRPSRKPVLQSGGEGTASWAGASQWGSGNDEPSGGGAAVLTRDDEENDSTVRVANREDALVGDDEPTRTAMPAPAPQPEVEAAAASASPWAPAAHDDTGDLADGGVRVLEPEPAAAPAPGPAAPADEDVVIVPKPSARGGTSPLDAGAGGAAGQAAAAASVPNSDDAAASVGTGAAATAARGNADDAARFEQVLAPIAGVGAGKRAALFQHFGTYRKLRAATPEKLAEVPGISRTLADRIHNALHGK